MAGSAGTVLGSVRSDRVWNHGRCPRVRTTDIVGREAALIDVLRHVHDQRRAEPCGRRSRFGGLVQDLVNRHARGGDHKVIRLAAAPQSFAHGPDRADHGPHHDEDEEGAWDG